MRGRGAGGLRDIVPHLFPFVPMPMLENYYERVSHNKETHNNNIMLRVPKIKLESTKRAFFYYGVVAYNTLPLELRTETNYGIFCKNLDLLLG